MSGDIQNTYVALARELDIKNYAPAYHITDAVVPVVLLHEHCEGDCLFSSIAYAGVVGAGTTLAGIPTAGGLTAGAYYVEIGFGFNVAVADRKTMVVRLGTTVLLGAILYQMVYGFTGLQIGNLSFIIPKMHIPDGGVLYIINSDAHAAADFLAVNLLVQPL